MQSDFQVDKMGKIFQAMGIVDANTWHLEKP